MFRKVKWIRNEESQYFGNLKYDYRTRILWSASRQKAAMKELSRLRPLQRYAVREDAIRGLAYPYGHVWKTSHFRI